MCYNVKTKTSRKELEQHFKATHGDDAEIPTDFETVSGFAHPRLPIIASEQPDKIEYATWGLIPNWVKDERTAAEMRIATLNARSETVFEKPSFRSIIKKRCLIPVNGFYEWQTIATTKKKATKKHFYIHLKSENLFALGGLYDEWVNTATGEISRGFSIVTVPANPLMAEIHNTKKRMPLILPRNTETNWLQPNLTEADIKNLMLPYTELDMEAEEVQKNNRPEQTGRLF